jgi:uncharacterized iron-regulated protein
MMTLFVVLILGGHALSYEGTESTPLFDVAKGQETTLFKELETLKQKRIILVGEHHNQESHHRAQIEIIKALHRAGVPLAIGLEMFRADSQKDLDLWVGGKMSKKDFQKVYYDNWNFSWVLYSGIFEYARDHQIPMVGLNVPKTITRKVARDGFQSLSEEEKGKLENVACRVDSEYMAFIKKAYGAHAHGRLNFTYFCEAQLVWDKVMAVRAVDYVKTNPAVSMVLLAGTGHAWKKGIPNQIQPLSRLPYSVILPEIPGSIEKETVGPNDLDYIVLGLSK